MANITQCTTTSALSALQCDHVTFSAVTGAAFVDSINPCAIAVLLILLTTLTIAKTKLKILLTGTAFIVAIYLTYFAIGVGLVGTLQLAGLANIIHKVVGIIAILIGLFNIKDYFWYGGGGFVMEVPRRWRPKMIAIIESVTSPVGAFVAGIAVTFFELPCTGGPYFFVTGLLAAKYNWPTIIGILLYYNLVFVLPLLVIVALLYLGWATIDKISAWKNKNIRLLHLIAGLIMVALGIYVFWS